MTIPTRPLREGRTPHGFSRMVNFCDAVVAIAITLLILPLVDAASNIGTLSVGELFAQNAFRLFVFVLSFAVIGNFWLVHHRLYEQVIDYNLPLLWANLLWLLTIVFLPFPTELLGSSGRRDLATYAVYIGTLILTSVATLLQQVIVVRSVDLQAPVQPAAPVVSALCDHHDPADFGFCCRGDYPGNRFVVTAAAGCGPTA